MNTRDFDRGFESERASEGRSDVRGRSRRRLEPALQKIVRRVIRHGEATSPMARNILDLARKIAQQNPSPGAADREALVVRVCQHLIDSAAGETPCFAPSRHGILDTSTGYRAATMGGV